MYLYPFKIFALSKNKRLFNCHEPNRTIGIYDVIKMNYNEALESFNTNEDCKISILLGSITEDVNLMVLDLDDCFTEDGELEQDTKNFLKEFNNSEYEISSSGTGIHIYVLTRMSLPTFIVKDLEGCKSFECYTNKRHIVTTSFDFINTNLKIGEHDEFIKNLYEKVNEKQREKRESQENSFKNAVISVFDGTEIEADRVAYVSRIRGMNPVTDMYTLRGCGYKDKELINIIDADPESVDQSAHDAKLIRKLMYYTYSFDSAWELAKKTNYYKHKDKRHQDKFNSERYKERTRLFLR